jgi:hypothetical protein
VGWILTGAGILCSLAALALTGVGIACTIAGFVLLMF